jgi:predicted ATPase
MLQRLAVSGLKSLAHVDVELKPLVVLFGPNSAGKSSFVDAVHLLSNTATARTVAEVFAWPLRGYPHEFFALPAEGLAGLLGQESSALRLEADLQVPGGPGAYRYAVELTLTPRTGAVRVTDELLGRLTKAGVVRGRAKIERQDGTVSVRRTQGSGHPRSEPLGLPHTLLSDQRFSGEAYAEIETVRTEVSRWRTYYLDPFGAMRADHPPAEVDDVGEIGQSLGAYLYRLKHDPEHGRRFDAVVRALRLAVPEVDAVLVDLDRRRGLIELSVRQAGTPFSVRVLSEGTLRVLALCAIAVNPWAGSLVALEEPENGVHPRRLDTIADLLVRAAHERQVIVTTHSPRFVARMVREQRSAPERVVVLVCRRECGATVIAPFAGLDGLFSAGEIAEALSDSDDEQAVAALLQRGWLDG